MESQLLQRVNFLLDTLGIAALHFVLLAITDVQGDTDQHMI
jgi:hypothetical protein